MLVVERFRGRVYTGAGECKAPPEGFKNCLVKVYCNFIVNLDRSL
jgi:hypothetical protein